MNNKLFNINDDYANKDMTNNIYQVDYSHARDEVLTFCYIMDVFLKFSEP